MTREKKIQALGEVKRIVVHNGLAHVDDIMACAIAFATGVPHSVPIERCRPVAADLESKTTLVLDVGGSYDPEKLNFDHHQRVRTEEPKCAYKLFVEWLDLDEEFSTIFSWYKAWNLVDVIGPFATGREMGVQGHEEILMGLIENPLADFVIRRFADDGEFRKRLALSLSRGIELSRRCWVSINENVVKLEICGIPVADFTNCSTEEISRCSDAWIRRNRPACSITRDNRGTGLTFLRCLDDHRLDFSRCEGKPYAHFCHPGGFVLKTLSLTDDPELVIRDARTDSPSR